MTDSKNTIDSVKRSLEIIELISDLEPAGVSEIAHEMPISKSTVYAHLSTLTDAGYVTKADGKYELSCKVLRLGSSVQERFGIYKQAKQHIDELAGETGEPTNLVIEENGLGTCLYATNPRNSADVFMSSGETHYMHATGTGKAILAHRSREDIKSIIDQHGLPKMTENTITDEDELFTELEDIRERGLSFDKEETINGLYCIAAPILIDEEPIGALSVSGPVNRFTQEERQEELIQDISEMANVIELRIVFS
ncbi:IclR family transcriptional regulator [Natronococcus jeotgali]|uniref:Transcriptional regulator, IclR family protein n=1 Tax=Natronococcus jeotgali DSM 18795 TaxID=1227498 RepID=L9XH99_9EURY|nr:IclR family transcriptional regulator [Natronococcus jeotgali]ELY60033.1 transcriptional regulator, IclR family protein [Natronococcus jeotgali DSM 18795]